MKNEFNEYIFHNYPDVREQEIHTIPFINRTIEQGHAADMILVGEALQEKALARIAEEIASKPDVKVVLLAGPSSSGKTSSSRRLCIQLMTCKKHPVALSLDNWFVGGDRTPLDENGKKDYESLYTMDLEQLGQDLQDLIDGKEIQLPTFNFREEKREYHGEKLRLTDDMILVMEGIHALNPLLTKQIDARNKYKIFAAPMSPISLDGEHWIPTTTNRLLRRLTRDYRTRGKSAETTIAGWESVRRGEDKWILPFKDEADALFDTSMPYEMAAIRPKIEGVLAAVPASSPEYETAQYLLSFLRYFTPIDGEQIPKNSLLKEFIGGSFFDVG